jgi:hypothetical protein
VNVAALAVAATLLAIERACYAGVARAPGVFLAVCTGLAPAMRGAPVAIIARLFYVFKVPRSIGWEGRASSSVTGSGTNSGFDVIGSGTVDRLECIAALTGLYAPGQIGSFGRPLYRYRFASVPEPGSGVLVVAGGLAMLTSLVVARGARR